MRKGGGEARTLNVREARPVWPKLLIGLVVLSPLLRDFALILVDWWEPFTRIAPPAGYKTPIVDLFANAWKGGFGTISKSFMNIVNAAFSTPTVGISIFLMIAGGSMLFMKGGQRR